MRFFGILVSLACAASVFAEDLKHHHKGISAKVVIRNINKITELSQSLRTVVTNVTTLNVYQEGPEIVNGFQDIVTTTTEQYNEMVQEGIAKFTAEEQYAANYAFATFVTVQQGLLETIVEKYTVLAGAGLAQSIANALRDVEAIVDKFALALISGVPTYAIKIKASVRRLDKALNKAIKVYGAVIP